MCSRMTVLACALLFCCGILSAETSTPTGVTQFPVRNVSPVLNCDLGDECFRNDGDSATQTWYHLGVDLSTKDLGNPNANGGGAPIYSPVDGVVKERTHHGGGYAGTVAIEFTISTPGGNEINTAFVGHLNYDGSAYPELQVSLGQHVRVGDLIGYTADQAQIDKWNEGYEGKMKPHVHWGIRKGQYPINGLDYSCATDGNIYAFKGYTSCASYVSQWYDPLIFTLDRCVGCYDDETPWHNDGSSQAFLDAYVRARGFGIGSPAEDAGNPNGTKVHCWLDLDPNQNTQCTGIDVQNFENSDPGKRGAILYRQGKDKAHMVRGKVWDWYRFHLNSPRTYGAPTADEGAWTDPSDGKVFPISQEFEKVRLAFDDVGSTPDREIPISQVTSAMIPIAPRDTAKDGTVGIAGGSSLYPAFTGGHEKHMLLVADQVTSSYVTFTITDETGIPCVTYRLNRNGTMLLDMPGTILTISDNGVSPNTEYAYDIECRLASGGNIGKSDSLNVKTPPNPRTYELLAYARDGYSAYLEIRDTLLIYFYPLHAILTVETCENADYKRRLMGTENSNKHKKLFCKMIFI